MNEIFIYKPFIANEYTTNIMLFLVDILKSSKADNVSIWP